MAPIVNATQFLPHGVIVPKGGNVHADGSGALAELALATGAPASEEDLHAMAAALNAVGSLHTPSSAAGEKPSPLLEQLTEHLRRARASGPAQAANTAKAASPLPAAPGTPTGLCTPPSLVGVAVRRNFPGYGVYTGIVGAPAELAGRWHVDWSDGSRSVMSSKAIAKHRTDDPAPGATRAGTQGPSERLTSSPGWGLPSPPLAPRAGSAGPTTPSTARPLTKKTAMPRTDAEERGGMDEGNAGAVEPGEPPLLDVDDGGQSARLARLAAFAQSDTDDGMSACIVDLHRCLAAREGDGLSAHAAQPLAAKLLRLVSRSADVDLRTGDGSSGPDDGPLKVAMNGGDAVHALVLVLCLLAPGERLEEEEAMLDEITATMRRLLGRKAIGCGEGDMAAPSTPPSAKGKGRRVSSAGPAALPWGTAMAAVTGRVSQALRATAGLVRDRGLHDGFMSELVQLGVRAACLAGPGQVALEQPAMEVVLAACERYPQHYDLAMEEAVACMYAATAPARTSASRTFALSALAPLINKGAAESTGGSVGAGLGLGRRVHIQSSTALVLCLIQSGPALVEVADVGDGSPAAAVKGRATRRR